MVTVRKGTGEPLVATPETYRNVFENLPEGVLVLEDLVKRFARAPVLKGGIDGVRENDHNGGARSVTEFIINRINQAHGLDANQE